MMKSYCLILLFFSFISFSQENFKIVGQIQNIEKQYLKNVPIKISLNEQKIQIQTDTIGYFSTILPEGKVIFEINYLDYSKKEFTYFVSKNDSIVIILEKDINQLNEVKIVAENKKRITTNNRNYLKINPDQLSNIPSLTGGIDIIKVLQLIPGVQNSGDANGYLYIRGGDPGHNLMLYENAPIYGLSHLLGIFPFYNSSHIDEVTFDKSSQNARYGGRLGATIKSLTPSKIPEKFTIKGNIGLLSSGLTLSAPISTKTGIFVSARKTYIDEIISPLFKSSTDNNQNLKYGFTDGNFTLISKLSEKHFLKLDAFVSSDNLKIRDESLSVNGLIKWSNVSITPTWKVQLSENITITNSAFFTKYANNLKLRQSNIEINVASYVQDIGFLSNIKYKLKNIFCDSGIQFVAHEVDPQKINIVNLGLDNPNKNSNKLNANEFSVYTNTKSKLSNQLDLDFGLRLNYYKTLNSTTSRLNLEPRLSLHYFPTINASFYACYSRQNQYLNLITASSVGIPTDFWIATTDGIPSQSSDEFSIGYNQNFKKAVNITSSAFYRTMQNLVEYPFGLTQFNQTTTLKNDILTGNGKAYGIELMLKKDAGKFRGWMSYTLSYATRQFDGLNNGSTFYAKYDRRHNLSVTATYDFNKKWNIGITEILSSGNRFTAPTSFYFINNNPVKEYSQYNNAQMPNYLRTDFVLQYWFFKTNKRESGISFSVYNTFAINNPIYINLTVNATADEQLAVEIKRQTLYTILPSINWLFKF